MSIRHKYRRTDFKSKAQSRKVSNFALWLFDLWILTFVIENAGSLRKRQKGDFLTSPAKGRESILREYSALDFTSGLDIASFFRLRHHFPRNLPQVPFGG
jgi:hypothetical protein